MRAEPSAQEQRLTSMAVTKALAYRLRQQRPAFSENQTSCSNYPVPDAQPVERGSINLHADPGILRDANATLSVDDDGFDQDIALEILIGGRDVARKVEGGEATEVNVERLPEAGLEHSAAPSRCAPKCADASREHGLAIPAEPGGLDVDYPRCSDPQCLLGVAGRTDAFVQTDRGIDLLLQLGMIEDVVPTQRLFQHHEPKGIELTQVAGVGDGVGRVGVGHERHVGMRFPNHSDDLDVPTRHDLDLDSPVTILDCPAHLLDQASQLRFGAQADSSLDPVTMATPKLVKRNTLLLRPDIPEGCLDSRLGRATTPDPAVTGLQGGGVTQLLIQD